MKYPILVAFILLMSCAMFTAFFGFDYATSIAATALWFSCAGYYDKRGRS